jgi:hypothetical protein
MNHVQKYISNVSLLSRKTNSFLYILIEKKTNEGNGSFMVRCCWCSIAVSLYPHK